MPGTMPRRDRRTADGGGADADWTPRLTADLVLTKTREIGGRGAAGRIADVRRMVALGLRWGDDLDAAERALGPGPAGDDLRRMRSAFGLVSAARGPGSAAAVTLSRVCLGFPAHACAFHHRTGGPRRVMASPAFAYLLPDESHECHRPLRDAHMHHRYEARSPAPGAESPARAVARLVGETRAAVRTSHVADAGRTAAMRRFGLLTDLGDGRRGVPEAVRTAAEAWRGLATAHGFLDEPDR